MKHTDSVVSSTTKGGGGGAVQGFQSTQHTDKSNVHKQTKSEIEMDTKAHPDQVAHRGYSTPPHPCLAVHVDALLPLLVEVNDLQPRPDVGEGGSKSTVLNQCCFTP